MNVGGTQVSVDPRWDSVPVERAAWGMTPRKATVRLTYSLTDEWRIRNPNRMMCDLLGFTESELENARVWVLLRPGETYEQIVKAEPDNRAAFLRLLNGESTSERVSSWVRKKNGKRVDLDCFITRDVASDDGPLFNLVCEAVVDVPPVRMQVLGPIDPWPLLTWKVADSADRQRRVQERLRQTAVEVEDARILSLSKAAQEREIRRLVHETVDQRLLENEALYAHPVAQATVSKPKRGGAPKKHADLDKLVQDLARIMAEADDFWDLTVDQIGAKLVPPLTRNALKDKMIAAGRMPEKGGSLIATLHSIGQQALDAIERSQQTST